MQVQYIQKLEEAFTKKQAFVIAEAIESEIHEEIERKELATKHDIKELELRLKIWLISAFILISAFFKALDYFYL